MRNVFSIMKTALIFALKVSVLSVTRLIYAANKAPTPNRPQRMPDKKPMIIKIGFELLAFESACSLRSISTPIKIITNPKIIFMICVSIFLRKRAPGIFPARTRVASGNQIFQDKFLRFLYVRIRLLGYPNKSSIGEMFMLLVEKLNIELKISVFANPHSPLI